MTAMNNDMSGFLDLEDYSKKYGVSLSTLRRRIRSNAINYKLQKGRYWIEDSSSVLEAAPLFSRHAGTFSRKPLQMSAPATSTEAAAGANADLIKENRMLKAEIAELQTLVRILEEQVKD